MLFKQRKKDNQVRINLFSTCPQHSISSMINRQTNMIDTIETSIESISFELLESQSLFENIYALIINE